MIYNKIVKNGQYFEYYYKVNDTIDGYFISLSDSNKDLIVMTYYNNAFDPIYANITAITVIDKIVYDKYYKKFTKYLDEHNLKY